jgi:hypothetical protein
LIVIPLFDELKQRLGVVLALKNEWMDDLTITMTWHVEHASEPSQAPAKKTGNCQ